MSDLAFLMLVNAVVSLWLIWKGQDTTAIVLGVFTGIAWLMMFDLTPAAAGLPYP